MLQAVLGTLGNISFILSDKWDHNMRSFVTDFFDLVCF